MENGKFLLFIYEEERLQKLEFFLSVEWKKNWNIARILW